MANSVISRNIVELSKSLQKNIDLVDISYKGSTKSLNGEKKATLRGGQPIINMYKMWLQSKSTDYIRNLGFGGFFENNLNEFPFDESSIPAIEEALRQETVKKFPDIRIIDIQIQCLYGSRKWKVKVVIADIKTGLIGIDFDDTDSIEFETPANNIE